MKNIKQNYDDLRPEYTRSDFADSVRGKHAFLFSELEFAELVQLIVVCAGEDEGLTFTHHSQGNVLAGHRQGDWTYELDHANQITLRYWTGEFGSIEEPISNPPCITTPQERQDLQSLLTTHIRALKGKVAANGQS